MPLIALRVCIVLSQLMSVLLLGRVIMERRCESIARGRLARQRALHVSGRQSRWPRQFVFSPLDCDISHIALSLARVTLTSAACRAVYGFVAASSSKLRN